MGKRAVETSFIFRRNHLVTNQSPFSSSELAEFPVTPHSYILSIASAISRARSAQAFRPSEVTFQAHLLLNSIRPNHQLFYWLF